MNKARMTKSLRMIDSDAKDGLLIEPDLGGRVSVATVALDHDLEKLFEFEALHLDKINGV